MCREILNSCVRNTEEAERQSKAPEGVVSGRGLGRGVWGMIEESELAKTIRQGEEKKVSYLFFFSFFKLYEPWTLQNETDIAGKAWTSVTELSKLLVSKGTDSPAVPKDATMTASSANTLLH